MTHFAIPPVIFAANPTAWLTPVWLLGLGCGLGLVVLAALYGLVRVIAPNLALIVKGTLHEGFITPVLSLAGGFAAFALLSLMLSAAGVGYLPLADVWRSIVRLPASSGFTASYPIPAVP